MLRNDEIFAAIRVHIKRLNQANFPCYGQLAQKADSFGGKRN